MNESERFIQCVEYLKENGYASSYVEIAEKLNTNKASINDIKAGRKRVSLETLGSMNKSYPIINVTWIVTGDGEMLREGKSIDNADVKSRNGNMIPLYEDVATIGGTNTISAVLDGVMPSSRYIDAGDWFKGATAAIRHYGDSMREYPSGCIIVIKEVIDKTQVVWGRNYCIETSEFRITKKLQKGGDPSSYTAYSTNTDTYPDGHLIHEPISIKVDNIRRLFLVMGCVIKEQSSGPVYIEDSI